MTQNPPSCSFVSANGPSVTVVLPPSTRTTVALSGGRSPPPKTQAPADCNSALTTSTRANWVCMSSVDGIGSPSTVCTASRYCIVFLLGE